MKKLLTGLAIIIALSTSSQADAWEKTKIVAGGVVAVGTIYISAITSPVWVPVAFTTFAVVTTVGGKEIKVLCSDIETTNSSVAIFQKEYCK